MNKKSWIWGVLAVVVIGLCGWWNWKVLKGAPSLNATLHRQVGEVLALETIKAVEGKGRVVLVTAKRGESEVLIVQEEAFRRRLSEAGSMELMEVVEMESDAKAKYGPGVGLSAGRFVRLVKKHPKADVVVSLVGLPELDPKEMEELGEMGPRFVAHARQMKKLAPLFDRKRLHGAVVPRFQFPSPVQKDPVTPQEWFDLQFQWVTAASKP